MKVDPIKVEYYVNENGTAPFEDWLESLKNPMTRSRIFARIAKLRVGNHGDYSAVGSGVSELREFHGAGYRIYYGKVGKKYVILLCGGDKKSQIKDIKLAKQYWIDFKMRSGINEME